MLGFVVSTAVMTVPRSDSSLAAVRRSYAIWRQHAWSAAVYYRPRAYPLGAREPPLLPVASAFLYICTQRVISDILTKSNDFVYIACAPLITSTQPIMMDDSTNDVDMDDSDEYGSDIQLDDELEGILATVEAGRPADAIAATQDIEEIVPRLAPIQEFRKKGWLSVSDLVGTVWCEVQVSLAAGFDQSGQRLYVV